MEAFFDEEWESLSRMFCSSETADFMFHLQGDHGFLNDHETTTWHADEANKQNIMSADDCFFSSCSDVLINADFQQYFSQECSNNDVMMMNLAQSESMGFFVMDQKNIIDNIDSSAPVCHHPNEEQLAIVDADKKLQQLKRKSEKSEEQEQTFKTDSSENPKKKPRVSRHVQKNKKAALSKSKQSNPAETGNEDQEDHEERNAQTSSCSSSDHQDESNNASQDLNRETPNSKRASRGAATDPQSLYARKRRERINERLRILQSLVPNGTKVDISTMLEEAVHYVKFLQLQIKLLSSEDLWMYAPIAYNGMDIGIYQKMLPSL